jgi:hypothetical protein
MSEMDPEKLAALRHLAESWLKRTLTAAELQELEAFARRSEAKPDGSMEQVREATRSVKENRASVEAHIRGLVGGTPQNAVNNQQQQNTLTEAAINQGIMQIYGVDTTAGAAAGTERVGQAGAPDNLTSLLAVLRAFDAQH